jgi:hypothetical protein
MKRIFLFLIVVFGLLGISYAYTNDTHFPKFYLVLFIPMLTLYYFLNVKSELKISKHKWVFIALGLLYISDLLSLNKLLEFQELKNGIQVVINFAVVVIYIYIFRLEGARMIQENVRDSLKIFIPFVLIFILCGFILVDENSIAFYLLFTISSISSLLLIILVLFRPVQSYSYFSGILGVIFMFLGNLFYIFYYFKLNKPFYFVLALSLYLFSQIFIFESFASSKMKSLNDE